MRIFIRFGGEPLGLPAHTEGIGELNAWCELAKSLKSKGGFTDTQTESRLVQRITPLFSMTASQQLTPSVEVFYKLVQNSGEQLPAIARPITTGAPDGPHAGNVKPCISIFTF